MNRYKGYFSTHFSSCRLLATCRDEHRDRDVNLYFLPGDFDNVGVSDGVDTWIAPVAVDPFSVSVRAIMQAIREGRELPKGKNCLPVKRHKVILEEENPTPESVPRRRVVL